MIEKIKEIWDDTELSFIRIWYDTMKGFSQLDEEYNLPFGTFYKIVN